MYTYKKNNLPKNTVELIIDIPKNNIKKEYEKAFLSLQAQLEVEGFRKGKAPREIAEKQLKKEEIYQELIRNFFPQIYEEIIKKEALRPIISPKIELIKAKENEDWQIKITLAEKPTVDLKNYKEIIKSIKAQQKKADIWVPGKDKEKKENSEENKQKLLNEILSSLLKNTSVEISDLIIEEQLNYRLSKLLDDIQKIGLTVDDYLKSKGLTIEELKNQYKKEIEETYKLEFILSEIADKESITVEKEDIDKLLVNIKDEKERQLAEANRYFYASILRKQKTLDYLLGL